MMTNKPEQHDGFQALRRSGKYWLDYGKSQLAGVDLLEALLPDFVRRRYEVSYFTRTSDKTAGTLHLSPVDGGTEDTEVANALHADVNKLFDWLLAKRTAGPPDAEHMEPRKPKRHLDASGSISYESEVGDLADFPRGLVVHISGLGAGSACRITRKVTGTHEVEDVEYEMVCDDDPAPEPDPVPAEDATQQEGDHRREVEQDRAMCDGVKP